MTRTSRTLLVLGLMSVGAVVVLAMMAQRYGKVLEQRGEARGREVRSVDAPGTSAEQERAAREIAVYLAVMASLKEDLALRKRQAPGEPTDDAAEDSLDRALGQHGLSRVDFSRLALIVRAWREGSPEVAEAYRRELDRRAPDVRASEIENLDLPDG
jgi:hypothetical protein